MFEAFVRSRITELRMQKDVSEYQMSLDLGHGKNYIHSITSGRTLPSLSELPYICEYLGVSVRGFFDDTETAPILIQELLKRAKTMDEADLQAIIGVMERIKPVQKEERAQMDKQKLVCPLTL